MLFQRRRSRRRSDQTRNSSTIISHQNDQEEEEEEKKGNKNSVICVLCYDTLTNPSITSSCGHLFCWDCIMRWLNRSSNQSSSSSCPICRSDISINSIIKLHNFSS